MRGDVLVLLTTERTERLDPGSVLHTDRGPLTVVRRRRHQDRWIVHFEGFDDRDAGRDAGAGVVLQAEPLDDDDDDASGCTSWSASTVVARRRHRGRHGRRRCEANPAADLLVLDTGALVPVVFITDARATARVTIDPPEGLFDL